MFHWKLLPRLEDAAVPSATRARLAAPKTGRHGAALGSCLSSSRLERRAEKELAAARGELENVYGECRFSEDYQKPLVLGYLKSLKPACLGDGQVCFSCCFHSLLVPLCTTPW